MRLIFMGTPDFSVPTLKALIESRHEIVGVYTQPDREQGRGKKLVFSPVKQCAMEAGLPVFQPKSLRKQAVIDEMRALRADAIIVVAYGQILRKAVLEMTEYGCINVHGSLLPKYRGAAPIQWAVLNGEKTSGVTIMQLDEGIDTGDILARKEIVLDEKETGDSLFEKLSVLGGPLLLEVLEALENGTAVREKQGDSPTEYARMLDKSMGLLDFTRPAAELERLVRGLNSWPSAYTYLNGKMLKVWMSDAAEDSSDAEPGTVIQVTKKDFTVKCGTDALKITELQPEGKKRMETAAFLLGYRICPGDRIGQ